MGSISFEEDVVVLMVPFPLQGHLNQLLHLSRLVTAYHIPVHFVATTACGREACHRMHGWDPLSISNLIFHNFPSIYFHFATPDSTAPIQPHFDGPATLRQPVAELLSYLSATTRRVVVIYDSLMGSVVQDFVKFPNAEAYTFHSVSAYTIFFFLWENKGRPFDVDPGVLEKLPSLDGCFTPEFAKFIRNQHKYLSLNSGRIYNSSRVVENSFLELLSKPEISGGKAQWALGPFNPLFPYSGGGSGAARRHRCLKWLDRQAPSSVIFVSFGTSTTLTAKQIHELASGLESSEEKFIWVIRDADDGGSAATAVEIKNQALPIGFEERVKERGMVVRDWAPQLEILKHPATGGFLSHCGWNSCIESISMGVPIAAWPMHSDQPRNAVLVTELLRIGIVVRDWDRRGEIVTSSEVKRAVRRLMASEEGEEMRRRAAELGGSVRTAVAEGGATRLELDSFISHISR